MTDREKLIEILRVPIYPHELADPAEVVADYLLDNGVTFVTDNNVGHILEEQRKKIAKLEKSNRNWRRKNQRTRQRYAKAQEDAKLYWKPVENGVWNLTCSACDSHLGCREDSKFCPECGAKFRKYIALSPEPPKEVE